MTSLLLITLAIGAEPALPAWNADIREAAKHAAGAPGGLAKHLRYVTDYTAEGLKEDGRTERARAQNFGLNLTSREAVITSLTPIGPTCYVLDIRRFGWSAAVWEKLAENDPYFHRVAKGEAKATFREVKKKVPVQYGYRDSRGVWHDTRVVMEEKVVKEKVPGKATAKVSFGRGIDPIAIKTLCEATGSNAPIVRLDWLVWMLSGQDERGGAGYYDFLGVKDLKTFEDRVALDRKKAEGFPDEVAAIIRKSGVALRSRQIWRYGKIGGGYWESRDVFRRANLAERKKKNALTQLDKKFEPDAFEIFASLPNGLFALAALNDKGELQAIVPNKIAGDHFGKGNDYVIEPGMKCLRCHTEGLQPLDDYGRKFFRAARWDKHDFEQKKRLEQLYLGPLQDKLKEDVDRYLSAVKRFGYKTIAECHASYAKVVEEYELADLDAEAVARELGVPKEKIIDAVKRTDGLFGQLPALPVSRFDFEEAFDLYLEALGYH